MNTALSLVYVLVMYLFVVEALLSCNPQNQYNSRCKHSTIRLSALDKPMITIGTRASPLALAQAYETKRLLGESFSELKEEGAVEIKKIMTKGDTLLDQTLSEVGGKGLFTRELDLALLNKEVDICVHSMKDVPTYLPEGTILPCNLKREQTNDVMISKKFKSIKSLADGSVVGSASLRRQAQLLALNPSLKVVNFRGNVQTRLMKLENGVVDATLLALAGLRRLNMDAIIGESEIVGWDVLLPAVAQGAIGIQCRSNDIQAQHYLSKLNCAETFACVDCERSFLRTLDGNCRTPIAGQATLTSDGQLNFQGFISKPNGKDIIRVQRTGSIFDAVSIGKDAGDEVRSIAGNRYHEYGESFVAAITK